jgi:hypothetical protein
MMVNQHPSFLKLWRKLTITPSLSNNTSKHDVIFYHLQHEHLSLLLNNSSDNIWFIFKIPFQNICTIMSFLTWFLTRYLKPIVFKFYHVLALGRMFGL